MGILSRPERPNPRLELQLEAMKKREMELQLQALEETEMDPRLRKLVGNEFKRLVELHPSWKKWKAIRKAGERYGVRFNPIFDEPQEKPVIADCTTRPSNLSLTPCVNNNDATGDRG